MTRVRTPLVEIRARMWNRVAAVRQGMAEGLSMSQIAQRIGVTKNSISGLVSRHIRTHVPRKPKRVRKPRPQVIRLKAPKPVPAPRPPPVQTCQWLEGNDRKTWKMCGAPVCRPGSAWCVAHYRRVYVRRTYSEAA